MSIRKTFALLSVFAPLALTVQAQVPELPGDMAALVQYGSSRHSGVIGDKYTQPDTIQTVQTTGKFPYGAVIVGIEYENVNGQRGDVARYIVMQKRRGGGAQYPSDIRNGEWEFATYTPEKKLITDDPVERCLSCHNRAEDTDYVFGFDKIKNFVAK